MSEKFSKMHEITSLRGDDHHRGDEERIFAFRNTKTGEIIQILRIGKVYCIKYQPALETASGKKIRKATGLLGDVSGHIGLVNATIEYQDGTTLNSNMSIGFIKGMSFLEIS